MKTGKCQAAGLAALLLLPAMASAEIVQRQVIVAISSEPDSEGADVLTLAAPSGCGGKQLRMDARTLGMNDADYAVMRPELAKRIRDKTPLLVSLDGCPKPGSTGEAAVPVIRKLVGCSPSLCADGKARLYLDENLFPQERRRAPYALVVPLPPGKQKNTWKVDIFTTQQGKTLRLATHVDGPDYVHGNRVGGYTFYYPNGQVEQQVPQNANGRQEGESVSYYEDGRVQSRSHWRDGLPEGRQSDYHKTGQLREAVEYRNGARLDGPAETFDEDGKLRTRMTYVDGKLEGEMLTYYPDGTVASRNVMNKGKFNGLSTIYYRDGKVRSTVNQINDAPDGEEREYHPDGKLASLRVYSDNGVLRSDQQYNEQGVLRVQRQWDRRQREQGSFRSWYDNGKPQQLVEYVDGQREGWSRTWSEDGMLQRACRFVADKEHDCEQRRSD